MSEELLKGSLKAPSTYKFISFEEESIETMGDELKGRIELFQQSVDFDKYNVNSETRFVEDAKESLKDSERDRKRYGSSWDKFVEYDRQHLSEREKALSDAKAKLEKDQGILDALIKLQDTEDLSQETGKIYVLTYEAQNNFGVPLRGEFRTHFKSNGELVSYRSDDGGWVSIGKVFSIPGYYEMIGETSETE